MVVQELDGVVVVTAVVQDLDDAVVRVVVMAVVMPHDESSWSRA